ncbi:MAG: isochorismate synthase [Flavobacteriaceae bacterium]|mgnify:CR=1 FL=1|nr:isochorismate synthase [Flavobacteriaceae bacterium]MBT6705692.1 isochorismate synthase [Flavobacteriaceae bacterium]MBT7242965.1 isochorismate synthase [Flavobacteriaceae bacterium]
MPNSKDLTIVLQNNNVLYDTTSYAEESFAFAPFDYHGKALCIPLKKSVFFETEFILNTIDKNDIIINEDLQTKKNYCKQVKKAISVIKSSNASKIVLSRKKEIDLKQFDISILIKRLLNLYPNAFRYIWYHPQTGFWCGASPEVLLEMERISFATMALAGTQRVKKDAIPYWNFKELNEQKIVVDSIAASLQKVASVIRTSETYNYQAASLVHLRTDITGTLKEGKNTLSMIASILHPTPAVCGTPQDYAKSYILDNEDYSREFYTGFLGPIYQKDSCSKLFVNLRCMKIDANIATLFVGGGITIDSEPESEWEETQHKLQTMLQVIYPML